MVTRAILVQTMVDARTLTELLSGLHSSKGRPMRLTGPELLDWIGLRQVTEGGVVMHSSEYVHWGRKVPCYLSEVFGRLIEAELTDLLDMNREGLRRMVVTPYGRDRYQSLSTKGGFPVDPEQSSGDCSVHPLTGRYSRLRPVRGFNEMAIRW